ncbi:Cortactin-binding protein 2 [Bienertia sinuspersici]
MHTTDTKSFTRIREEMQLPSSAQLFERTRKRQENKRYADTYEDTTRKIEAMKNYTPTEDGSGLKDPYLGVMEKEYAGRRRLYGRGMTNKVLNKVSSSSVNYVEPDEVMDALRADVQNEKIKVVDMRKELEADYECKKAELEANYAKKMEEFDKTKDKMVQNVLEKLISKLPTIVVREFLT